eukprot:6402574-Pyramimonas_sp.AAC.1
MRNAKLSFQHSGGLRRFIFDLTIPREAAICETVATFVGRLGVWRSDGLRRFRLALTIPGGGCDLDDCRQF